MIDRYKSYYAWMHGKHGDELFKDNEEWGKWSQIDIELKIRDKVNEMQEGANKIIMKENHWLKNCYKDIKFGLEHRQYKAVQRIIAEIEKGVEGCLD
jgi:hypothetical protein